MDFIDRIRELSVQASKQIENVHTEEATKTAFVMPFIQALGYNVFDPTEVVPEFISDVGIKKGEKVDYAIFQDGKPIILIECKTVNTNLRTIHASQLYRYFSVTAARFGILTDGIRYHFYSDIEAPNIMDSKPFLVVDILKVSDGEVEELKKFTKSTFDIDYILTTASDLKYTREIKKIIGKQLVEPDEDLIKFFAGQVYPGRLTPNVKEDFAQIIMRAFKQFINDRVNDRLQTALTGETVTHEIETTAGEIVTEIPDDTARDDDKGGRTIITTQDEVDGYFVVKSILREIIEAKRVAMRDTQSYCGVLLDDNNRKPICRLHFNRAQRYLGLFDENKNETRHAIESVDDIYNFAKELKAAVGFYESSSEETDVS
jgi:hypothetical protein